MNPLHSALIAASSQNPHSTNTVPQSTSAVAAALFRTLNESQEGVHRTSALKTKPDRAVFQQLLLELLPAARKEAADAGSRTGNVAAGQRGASDGEFHDYHTSQHSASETSSKETDAKKGLQFAEEDSAETTSSYPMHDPGFNIKLVHVIVSAGLTVLLQDDPFTPLEQRLSQASDCLAILNLTLQKTPEILVSITQTDSPGNPDNIELPLCLWLLPRLIPVLGHKDLVSVQGTLLDTVSLILIEMGKLPAAWVYLKIVNWYLGDCAEYLIEIFRSNFKTTVRKLFTVDIPSENFLSRLSPDEPQGHSSKIFQFSISSAGHAAAMVIKLCYIFGMLSSHVHSYPVLRVMGDDFTRLLEAISCLVPLLDIWDTFPHLGEEASRLRCEIPEMLTRALSITLQSAKQNSNRCRDLCLLQIKYISKLLERPLEQIDQITENTIASALLSVLQCSTYFTIVEVHVKVYLLPCVIQLMGEESKWQLIHRDLKLSLLKVYSAFSEDRDVEVRVQDVLRQVSDGVWKFQDPLLQIQVNSLQVTSVHVAGVYEKDISANSEISEYPRKRQKIRDIHGVAQNHGVPSIASELTSKLYRALGNQEASDLHGLSSVACEGFANLSITDRCTAIKNLGLLPCALAGTLVNTSSAGASDPDSLYCSFCDSCRVSETESKLFCDSASAQEIYHTIKILKDTPAFQRPNRIRIWAMRSLKRLINHSPLEDHNFVSTSGLGQWCLQSLQSSSRELRIAALFLLPYFQSFAHQDDGNRDDRLACMDYLVGVTEKKGDNHHETCLLAWSQIARTLEDEEQAVAIVRLIQYLGHSGPFIASVAYNEILSLSNHQNSNPRKLLTPFWRMMSMGIVNQLKSKPQILQLVCELISMDIDDFLKATIPFTFPYMILMKRHDVIERLRLASDPQQKNNITVSSLIMDNLPVILGVLLVQDMRDLERETLQYLRDVCEGLSVISLEELARSEPIPIASEILKSCGGDDLKRKHRGHAAMRHIAGLVPLKAYGQQKVKGVDPVRGFFEYHVLGIMTQFSDVIHDVKGRQPTLEKIRNIRAIEEMIVVARDGICSALPQICACLQSALENPKLRSSALSAWVAMMLSLPREDIAPLLSPSICIILKYWHTLNSKSQEVGVMLFKGLMSTHHQLLREYAESLPSLEGLPALKEYEDQMVKWKTTDERERFRLMGLRISHENSIVVEQSLLELARCLRIEAPMIHTAAIGEIPDPVVAELIRQVLDACVKYNQTNLDIADLCAECLGLIGAIDTNRIDAPRHASNLMVLHNFERVEESIDFVIFFLETCLVKSFLSVTDTKAQGFLSFSMQELLKFCGITDEVLHRPKCGVAVTDESIRWAKLSALAKNTLAPFLTSRYILSTIASTNTPTYPIFNPGLSHRTWLTYLIMDLLQKPNGNRATTIFTICSRVIKGQDVAILIFLLPYIVLNIIVGGNETQRLEIRSELLAVLSNEVDVDDRFQSENVKRSCETVFSIIDHLSRWLHEKKRYVAQQRVILARQHGKHHSADPELEGAEEGIANVEKLLSMIPPKLMAERSVECHSFARALFYWEQYIRSSRDVQGVDDESLYIQLQSIYSEIDEPDGIEGISTRLHVLNVDQQILEHKKAGRWTAVQSWYEYLLKEKPQDRDLQLGLLSSLKELGQYETLLNHVDGLSVDMPTMIPQVRAFAVEASWTVSRWDKLERYLADVSDDSGKAFDLQIGQALLERKKQNSEEMWSILKKSRCDLVKSISSSITGSFRQCRDILFQLHVVSDIELMVTALESDQPNINALTSVLDGRMNLVGPSVKEKQYLLALRRAVLSLSLVHRNAVQETISSSWLLTSKLARKSGDFHQAFNAVLNARELGDQLAPVEHARLLWSDGQHRKAITILEGTIATGQFRTVNTSFSFGDSLRESEATGAESSSQPQSYAKARAILLLAKWLDHSSQSQSSAIIAKYQQASEANIRWEKGHYYLGRHYNKILEMEKKLPPNKKSQACLTGETIKLVCSNYMRCLTFGTKYIFQTLPRILTLWLDFGANAELPIDSQHGNEDFRHHVAMERIKQLKGINLAVQKYMLQRIPTYLYLTAFPQIMSRICHPSESIWGLLQALIIRIVSAFPQHGLWYLMAAFKSNQMERKQRGHKTLLKLKDTTKSAGTNDLKSLIVASQKLVQELLSLCNAELKGKPSHVSIQHDLGFNHAVAPIGLIVPLQSSMTISFPPGNILTKSHNPFSRNITTISKFEDEAAVMSSLQKPRKITIRGSDGKRYAFLCKPKDDLRKDARLMEFNMMINKLLKKDGESSKRKLHIRTYAVTPLNEECGLIEWVNNVRPLRDILLKSYRSKNIKVDYNEIRTILDEACSDPSKSSLFTERLLPRFPPVFHEWFVETFAEPVAWFESRLAFARTAAVMSMTGYILGLGDRHGENILFDETNGDVLHVDFNCLFDKGLTFDKPERVPFRLTQNMVDALGVTGYDGPFRRSSEVALRILRQNEDSLMTVLETFVHDPLVEWMSTKKRRSAAATKVPDNPKDVLETIQNKLRGIHGGEPVPLSVEGQVQELIRLSVSPENLAAMYIGWCAFF